MENKLSVSGLSFGYEKGKPILRDVSVEFAPGKITALIGANGCGKSTLLNLLAGVLRPDSGTICLNGCDSRQLKHNEIARTMAVVHQSNTAPADMTVERLVSLGRTPYQKWNRGFDQEDREAVRQAMADTHILDFADRRISALSGGQLQRVWLAMALAQQTEILLLDEITTYLDIHYQLEILHMIRQLNQNRGKTIIMVLHDINQAFEFCDRVLVMKEGRVLTQGPLSQAVIPPVLDEAFEVSSRILTVAGKQHCVFTRRGE